ncbi:MAG: SLBB domain-containing protein [Candidatus Edwardsbacteria bacterium]|jgi:protein involved in polysaccharide export with SLBB domain|nr:SLBB domain-containing protein [Candidatus Edwardsbacteria bacterium]
MLVLAAPALSQRTIVQQTGLDWTRERPAIKVQVLGQVRNPGLHTLQAYDRVANAVGVAGGPNEQASIRSVVLIRGGQPIDTLDLYRYMTQNRQEENPEVRDGDIVFFPLAENMVTIAGQVFRPGKYEIKQGERLMDAIVMAGGFTPIATRENIKVQNIARLDSVISIDFKRLSIDRDPALDIPLQEGDIITVPTTPTTITVVGQVQKGGTFPFEPGTLLSYYIGMAGGYAERASTGNIRINRWGGKAVKGKESTTMEPGDVVVVGEMQIKGWRDYINLLAQVTTMGFIVWQVARVQ